jgi:threonine/homoserine/homoserine lactone efflux protein
MAPARGDVLPLAVAIAICPVPVIAAVLLVGSHRGVAKGLVFLLGWCVGLLGVGAVVLLFTGAADASDSGERAAWVDALVLGLGVVAVAAGLKQWHGRPRADGEAATPAWMRTIDGFTIARAGLLGLALTALNPKNLVLTVAAAAEIAGAGLTASGQAAVLVGFVLLASAGVATPVALAVAMGERSREPLAGLRDWMARHNAAVMTVLLLVIGAKLIGDAIAGFAD